MSEAAHSGPHPLDTMLAVSEVLTNRRYATIYARVLECETPTVEEIAEGVDSSTTTVYEDVDYLREVEFLERVTETQPHRYRACPVELTVQTGEESQISPILLVALAQATSNENLKLYLNRHGIAGLATAVEYAREYVKGQTNARLMSRELDIPVLEAETILQELRDVILDVEPELATTLDIDELDEKVAEQSPE